MAGKPAQLKIDIVTDASAAQKDIAKTGDSAKSAAGDFDELGQAIYNAMAHNGMQISDSAENMEKFGGAAGDAASGMRDLATGLAVAGIGDFTAQAEKAGAILEGLEGATKLYTVATQIMGQWQKIVAVGTKAWAAAQWLLNAAMNANPLGLIIIGVLALIAVIVLLWTKSETFRTAVLAIWSAMKDAAVAVWSALKNAAMAVFNFLVPFIQAAISVVMGIWNALKTAITTVLDFVTSYIRFVVLVWVVIFTIIYTIVKAIFDAVWENAIKPVLDLVAGAIKAFYTGVIVPVFNAVKAFITPIWRAILDGARKAFDLIKGSIMVWWNFARAIFAVVASVATSVFRAISNAAGVAFGAITAALRWVSDVARSVWSAISGAARTAFDAITGVVRSAKNTIVDIFNAVTRPLIDAFQSVRNRVGDIINAMVDAMRGPIDTVTGWFNSIKDAIERVVDWIGRIHIPAGIDKILGHIGLGRALPGSLGLGTFGLRAGPLAAGPLAAASGLTAAAPLVFVTVSIGNDQLDSHVDARITASNSRLARRITNRAQVLR
jgi:phage-related protein